MSETQQPSPQVAPAAPSRSTVSPPSRISSETGDEEIPPAGDIVGTDDPASLASNAPASPSPKKPSKRTTVEELRSALGELGLDAKGKKDSLYK